jgi:DNA-binding NarL/FixJ family response regulator
MALGEVLKQLSKALPIRRKPGPKPWPLHLSPREIKVVDCIASGMTDKDIAYALRLTIATVKVYISVIYRKLLHLPGNSRVGVALRVAKSRYVCPHCGAEGPDLWLTLRD